MTKLLSTIRLSYIYPGLFILFMVLLSFFEPQELSAGQLALFSVNSFLFGYFFGPVLDSQKSRVRDLGQIVRKEKMVLLDILAQSHLLPDKDRHELKVKLEAYIDSIIDNEKVESDNIYYDELLRYTKQDKFKDNSVMDTVYQRLTTTQENRDDMSRLYATKLFSHEWLVLMVLFSIIMYFTLQTDYGGVMFFRIMLAILCTGISLLIVILLKYSTLTHKEAKRIWKPLHELKQEHFEDVTLTEVKSELKEIQSTQ